MVDCRTLICLITVAGLQCAPAGAARRIELGSKRIAISVDADSGQLTSIRNFQTGETYSVRSDVLQLDTDAGLVSFARMSPRLTSRTRGSCSFTGQGTGLVVKRVYSVGRDRSYFNCSTTITNTLDKPVVLKAVTDCGLTFGEPFCSTAYHDDNMEGVPESGIAYHTSINVFMRTVAGGILAGIKYPYFIPTLANDSVALSYETNYELSPGETLRLPEMFCGVCKKTGYVCRKALHWTPRVLSTTQEEMDWGEVRAMQQVMKDHLPQQSTSFPGYYLFLNVWWANRNLHGAIGENEAKAYRELIDLIKKSKCIDPLLAGAPVWMGWAGFLVPSPQIDSIGADAVFPVNPHMGEVLDYARSVGVRMGGFCEPTAECRHYRRDRPDWDVVYPAEVSDMRPPWHRTGKCHANPEYEDWFYRLLCSTIDTCSCALWAWDYAWMRYPCLCTATNHGHRPGNCEFQQYLNVTGVIERLRRRYPKAVLATFWGLKEAGPWALRGTNYTENAYENASPSPPEMSPGDDLRFQHWYNHNYRFLPTYMNLAQIYFDQPNGHLYSILSALSASTGATLNDWIPFKTDEEADRIFSQLRKWKTWATRRQPYLRDRIDLFGQPCRADGIDGTAHIRGDKGFIFVFNPWPRTHWGSIPLNEMIGLTKGSRFSLDDITGEKPRRLGVSERGSNFVFPIGGKSALLIELKTTDAPITRTPTPPGVRPQEAFSSCDDTT